MATAAKFRIDVAIHDLLMNSTQRSPAPAEARGLTLPEPIFPQFPERLTDPGPETPPEKRKWGAKDVYRYSRGWLGPYLRSRVLPGDFHPITAYLFVEYKCNLDCWYCWAYNNKVKGMTEDVARRSIDWLHDNGCRVLALMGGEPLLRPDFVHKVVYYAAKKGFWVYIATNGRLLRPEVADRLGDAGVAVFNFALDAWDLKPEPAESLCSRRRRISNTSAQAVCLRLHGVFQHQHLPQQSRGRPASLPNTRTTIALPPTTTLTKRPCSSRTSTSSISTTIPPTSARGLARGRLADRLDHREE